MQFSLLVIVGVVNVFLCGSQCWRAVRRRSAEIIVWAFALLIAVAMAIEGLLTPITYRLGLMVYTLEENAALEGLSVVFLFNLMMATSAFVVARALPSPPSWTVATSAEAYPPVARALLVPLFAVYVLSSVIYGGRLLLYSSYADRYNEINSAWDLVGVNACWSILPLAVIYGRKIIALAVVACCVVVIALAQVRYFALFYLLPFGLLSAFKFLESLNSNRRLLTILLKYRTRIVLLFMLGLGVVGFLATVEQVRDDGADTRELDYAIRIPELWLTRGYYQVASSKEDGTLALGPKSYERLFQGLAWPYLRLVDPNWTYDNDDIPMVFAEVIAGLPRNGIHHWPFLIYSDAVATLGAYAPLLGVLWGAVYATMAHLARAQRLLPFALPFVCWFMYMTMRGAIGNSVASIPRELYVNLLLAALVQIGWVFGPRLVRRYDTKSVY
jgi:hypothetical protein